MGMDWPITFAPILAWNLLRKEVWGDSWESANFVMINCVLFSWVVLQNWASEHVRSWQCWYFPVSCTAPGPQTIMSHLSVPVSGEQTFVLITFCTLSCLESLLFIEILVHVKEYIVSSTICIGYLLSMINVLAEYRLVSLKSGLFWCQMTAF